MSAIAIPLDGVKGRQQKMWASGDYAAVAARIHPMAERLCESADLVAGARVRAFREERASELGPARRSPGTTREGIPGC
jgi:hypothetical protein